MRLIPEWLEDKMLWMEQSIYYALQDGSILQRHKIIQRIDPHEHDTDKFTQALFAMEHSGVIYSTDLRDNRVTYQLTSIKDEWTPRLHLSDHGGRWEPAAETGGLPNVSP